MRHCRAVVKVAFIGAGSIEFTRNVVTDLCSYPELAGDMTLALHDISADRLEFAAHLTRQIVAEAKDKLAEGQKEKGNTAEAASAGPKRNPVPVNSLQNRLRGVACDP